jgi:hypothetical protein
VTFLTKGGGLVVPKFTSWDVAPVPPTQRSVGERATFVALSAGVGVLGCPGGFTPPPPGLWVMLTALRHIDPCGSLRGRISAILTATVPLPTPHAASL